MYKMRLKKWSLTKFSSSSSRTASTHRRRPPPPTSVSWPAITQYLTHHPTTHATLDPSTGHLLLLPPTSPAPITSPTPFNPSHPLLSIPPPLAPDTATSLSNDVLRLQRSYMDGAFSSSLWHYSPHARCYLGTSAGYVGMHRVSSWTSDICWAVDESRRRGNPGEVVRVVNAQMDHLTVMMREQDASLFPQMLRACLWLWEWDVEVFRVVVGFVGGMCEVQLGKGHPLTGMWKRVRGMGGGALRGTVEGVARARLDYFKGRGDGCGSMVLVLEEWFMAGCVGVERGDRRAVERLVEWVLGYVQKGTGGEVRLSGDYCRLMLRLAAPLTFYGDYEAAGRLLGRVGEWLDGGDVGDIYYTMVAAGYRCNLSLMLADLAEHERSREEMLIGVRLCTQFYEPSSHLVSHVQHYTMSFGVEGDPEKAARWRLLLEAGVKSVWKIWEAEKKIREGGEVVAEAEGPGKLKPKVAVADEDETARMHTHDLTSKTDCGHPATTMPAMMPKDQPCLVNPIGLGHPNDGETLPVSFLFFSPVLEIYSDLLTMLAVLQATTRGVGKKDGVLKLQISRSLS